MICCSTTEDTGGSLLPARQQVHPATVSSWAATGDRSKDGVSWCVRVCGRRVVVLYPDPRIVLTRS
jgi:hypothetical protein